MRHGWQRFNINNKLNVSHFDKFMYVTRTRLRANSEDEQYKKNNNGNNVVTT